MSNGIKQRQNEKKSIMLLAAQRQLYNEVGIWDIFNFVFSVVIPFILSIISLIYPQKFNLSTWTFVSTSLILVATFFVSTKISKEKVLAATIQQYFDTYIYSMPWNEDLFGSKEDLDVKISDNAGKIMNNNSEQRKLRNWYSVQADEISLLEGIFKCQRENYHWDVGLRKRCQKMIWGIIIVFIISIFVIELALNDTVGNMVIRCVYIFPVLKWAIPLYKNLSKDIDRLIEIEKEFSRIPTNKNSMKRLQRIQKELYEHRKSAVKIPNAIYRFFRDNDEDREHQLMGMD